MTDPETRGVLTCTPKIILSIRNIQNNPLFFCITKPEC